MADGEIARDALGVTAEELIRDRWENAVKELYERRRAVEEAARA